MTRTLLLLVATAALVSAPTLAASGKVDTKAIEGVDKAKLTKPGSKGDSPKPSKDDIADEKQATKRGTGRGATAQQGSHPPRTQKPRPTKRARVPKGR